MSRICPSNNRRSFLVAILAVVTLVVPLWLPPVSFAEGPTGNLVRNWSLERWQSSYDSYNGCPLHVASDWTRFHVGSEQPRYMKDTEYADCFGGINRSIEGSYSQNWWEGDPFNGGIYQRIPVTSGKPYSAKSWMLSIYDSSSHQVHNKLWKQVGIDPLGGTDPESANIVWGEADGLDVEYVDVRTAAIAQASTITLFIRAFSNDYVKPSQHQLWSDAVVLEPAPTVSASCPTSVGSTSIPVSWQNLALPPNAELEYYDVQVKDGANGAWEYWKKQKSSTADSYIGVQNRHTYYFRARAWASYDGIKLYGAFSPGGDCQTTVGQSVTGYVRTITGLPIRGATVTASSLSTTTDSAGHYTLTGPSTGNHSLTAAFPGLNSPPGVPFTISAGTGTVAIDSTLRPAGTNPVANPDFEQALGAGWVTSSSGGGAPAIQPGVLRSGAASLALRQGASTVGNSRVQQIATLGGMYKPVLSFYARTVFGSGDRLVVGRYTGPTYTPLLTLAGSAGWTPYHVLLDGGGAVSGPMGIYFEAQQSSLAMQAYIDEVVVGKSAGGAIKTFLPIVVKNSAQ